MSPESGGWFVRHVSRLAIAALVVTGSIVAGAPASATAPVAVAAQAGLPTAGGAIATRSVTLSEPSGMPRAGSPAVQSVRIVQDVAKSTVTVAATFAAPPVAEDASALIVYLGSWSGRTCTATAGLGVAVLGHQAQAEWIESGSAAAVSLGRSGATSTATLTGDGRLGSTAWSCAYALTTEADGSQTYQSFGARDLEEAVVTRAKLVTSFGAADVATTAGKYTKVRVTVKNSGNGAATNVKVTLTGKGLRFAKRTVALGAIPAGREKTKIVKVRLIGSKARTLKAAATATGKLRATASATVLRTKKTTRPKSLTGRYYWGFDTSYTTGWDNRGIKFVSNRWAYVGFPKKGTVACSAKVKGCQRYTYNARTGVVKVGKTKGKVSSKQLTLGKKKYSPLLTPKKGTRLKVALVHKNFHGCMTNLYCTTWTDRLFLDTDGRFVRTQSSISSSGVPGVSQVWGAGVKPDERGRYRILSNGRIQFTYASGRKVTRTIGIDQDVREKPAPQRRGLLIGDVNFYPERW